MNKSVFHMIKLLFVAIPSLLNIATGPASAEKDKRLLPISQPQLIQAIRQTSITSAQQEQLISRARKSSLIDVAYNEYTLLAKKRPNSARATLLKGMTAEILWQQCMDPVARKRLSSVPSGNFWRIAGSCFAEALKQTPGSSSANLEYGYFLWQFGNDMRRGLTLIQKAVALNPKDPRCHCILGLVYSNPTGNAYNLQDAVKELQRATELDPTYAFPHSLLASAYSQLKQKVDAQRELQAYTSLLPDLN